MKKKYVVLGGGGSFGVHTSDYLLKNANPERVIAIGRHSEKFFLCRLRRFHRCGAFVNRGGILVSLAAEESIEILESSSARRPLVEWT